MFVCVCVLCVCAEYVDDVVTLHIFLFYGTYVYCVCSTSGVCVCVMSVCVCVL